MISRTHRFHGRNSLNYVYQRGKTAHSPQLSLRYIRNERRQEYRVAVVVSKKTNKSAVVRNRIRRRLYETIRLHKASIQQPYDIVLTVFDSDLASLPSQKLESLVSGLLKQAGIA